MGVVRREKLWEPARLRHYRGLGNRRWMQIMPTVDDLSRSRTALNQDSTLLVVVEMRKWNWLAAGMAPGIDRHPMKKLDPDPAALLDLIGRWRGEAERMGRRNERVALAFEAGRDGFWLARWLQHRGIDTYHEARRDVLIRTH
jgi:transposase